MRNNTTYGSHTPLFVCVRTPQFNSPAACIQLFTDSMEHGPSLEAQSLSSRFPTKMLYPFLISCVLHAPPTSSSLIWSLK